MNVLVAIDSSDSSQAVIDHTAARAWPQGTAIHVLNVVDTTALVSAWVNVGPFVESLTAAGQALVESAAKRLAQAGVTVSPSVVTGYAAKVIPAYAREIGADLVIVGSHGHGGLSRFLLGSVSKSALRTAACSVEIVRETARGQTAEPTQGSDSGSGARGLRILLATDGSECSLAAARYVARQPWPKGSIIHVVSVVDFAIPAMEPWYVQPGLMEQLRAQAQTRADEALRAAEQVLTGSGGVEVTGSVIEGNPKAIIVDEANEWGADLVVVGSHGRSAVERLLVGSVSEAVAFHASCSVDVIRPPKDDSAGAKE